MSQPARRQGADANLQNSQVFTRFLEGENSMRNYDLSPLLRQWIGFDKLASALQTAGESQSFPPYNI